MKEWFNLGLNRRSENPENDFWGDRTARLIMSARGRLDLDDLAKGLMKRIPFKFVDLGQGKCRYVAECDIEGELGIKVCLKGWSDPPNAGSPGNFRWAVAKMLINGGPECQSGLYAIERGPELTLSHTYFSEDAGREIYRSVTENQKSYLEELGGLNSRFRVVYPFRAMWDNSFGFLIHMIDRGHGWTTTRGVRWRLAAASTSNYTLAG